MGLNIIVRHAETGVEHPEWDSGRMGGDREFMTLLDGMGTVRNREPTWLDDSFMVRPADIQALRAALPDDEWDNPGRFTSLLAILDADPDWWIEASY